MPKSGPILAIALNGLGSTGAIGGNALIKWQQFERWGEHNLEYGTAARKAKTPGMPPAIAGLLGGALVGVIFLRDR
jgi:hypothetical protein